MEVYTNSLENRLVLGTEVEEEVDLGQGVKLTLVLIPPGRFRMGSPENEEGRRKDEQLHEVEITEPFYLGKYTATVGQFRRFVEDAPYTSDAERDGQGGWGYSSESRKFESRKPAYTWKNTGWKQTEEHPVVNVTWNDARAFCAWLKEKTGKEFGLPTEAQWEYSCRAGTTTRFYSGDEDASLRGAANVADASLKAKLDPDFAKPRSFQDWDDDYPFTAPVGKFSKNPFGLYDMHGNVWQWCQDVYSAEYYKESPRQNPGGPDDSAGSLRVIRGGSFANVPRQCRAATRERSVPARRVNTWGFRVVRVR